MKLRFVSCAAVLLATAASSPAQAPAKPVASKSPAAKLPPPDTARSAPVSRTTPETSAPRKPGGSAPGVRPPSAGYRLSKGDTVQLSVFNEEKLDDDGTLSLSGEVSFPLIGSVHLEGKTIKEAEDAIELLYERDYLVDARVTLALTGYAQHSVTVSGAVVTPGAVPIPQEGRFDILTAISAAGGFTEKANLRNVTLRPAAGGASIPCDVAAMQANPSLAHKLKPGDTLTIPYLPQKVARWVNVMGEVKSPAPVEVPESGRIDVLTAIASAGGYSRIAKPSKITVVRESSRGKQSWSLDAAAMAKGSAPLFYLLPGDTLTVAESRF